MRRNRTEDDVINSIAKKRAAEMKLDVEFEIFQQLLPAIRAVVRSGGGADQMLKKSEPLAAMKLIKSTMDEDPSVALKASTEILNRVSGRPVERTMTLFADVGRLNERDLDSQILRLMKQTGADGAHQLMGAVLDHPIAAIPKKKRRPRTPKIVEEAKAELVDARPETPNT